MPESIRETIITLLAELIDMCVFLSGPGSALWKITPGRAECVYCHNYAETVDEIIHFKGSKAGETVDGVLSLFGDPPCRVLVMKNTIEKAKQVLDLLKS